MSKLRQAFVLVRGGKEIHWGRGEEGKELFMKRGFLESSKSLKEIMFQKKKFKKNIKKFSKAHICTFCVRNAT